MSIQFTNWSNDRELYPISATFSNLSISNDINLGIFSLKTVLIDLVNNQNKQKQEIEQLKTLVNILTQRVNQLSKESPDTNKYLNTYVD